MIVLSEIQKILHDSKPFLSSAFHVAEIGVFGSYVRGEASNKSDLDILVSFFEPISFFKFLELEEYLSNILGVKVDLVSKKALKPKIGERIILETRYV